MSSAVVSVVVKSDRVHKKVPKVGQMVRVDGRAGLYEVVRVDRDVRVADVTRRGSARDSETNVPFRSILHVDAQVSKTIERFLKS